MKKLLLLSKLLIFIIVFISCSNKEKAKVSEEPIIDTITMDSIIGDNSTDTIITDSIFRDTIIKNIEIKTDDKKDHKKIEVIKHGVPNQIKLDSIKKLKNNKKFKQLDK